MEQTLFIDAKIGIGIRPFAAGDAQAYYEAAIESVPVAYQYMPWCHPDYSLKEAKDWIDLQVNLWQQNRSFGFISYDLKTEELVGAVEIAQLDYFENCADLGYWMRTSKTGYGYTTAAAFLAARFAFQVLNVKYLRIYCLPENIASRRIAEKLGAKLIEEIPNFLFMHSEMHTSVYYKLTPEDFFIALEEKEKNERSWWKKLLTLVKK